MNGFSFLHTADQLNLLTSQITSATVPNIHNKVDMNQKNQAAPPEIGAAIKVKIKAPPQEKIQNQAQCHGLK